MPGYANPQNLNRYSYVRNNPLRYTDPTGHYCVEENGNGNVIRVDCESSEPIGGGGGGNGGGDHDDDDDNEDYCSTHPASCELPLPAPSIIIPPLDGGVNEYDCFTNPITCGVETTHNSSEADGAPLVSIAGLLLLVNLGVLDIALGYGIIAAPSAGPLGLAAEMVLILLEVISLDLTIYAAQMAATGSTNHDPLLLIHGLFPDFLPYEP